MLHLIYASNHVEINILFSLPGWNFSLEFATFWCGKASAINHPQKRGWVLGPIFGMICNSNLAGQLRSMVHWCSLLGLLHYIVSVNPKIRSFWNIQNSSNFHQTFIKHMKKKTNPPKFWRGNTTVFPMKNADFPMKNGDVQPRFMHPMSSQASQIVGIDLSLQQRRGWKHRLRREVRGSSFQIICREMFMGILVGCLWYLIWIWMGYNGI